MFTKTQWNDLFKFSSGGFFIDAVISGYLYAALVSIPIIGTGLVVTHQGLGALYNL